MKVIALLAVCFAAVAALPTEKIAGGSIVPIQNYPSAVALLYTQNWFNYIQACGGSILNSRAILTSGGCAKNDPPNRWRVRVGSSYGNHGGAVYSFERLIVHPNFDLDSMVNDVAIMRTSHAIAFSNVASVALVAGANYHVGDNQALTAVGWGRTLWGGSDQLRQVQVNTINHSICATRYMNNAGITINNNMFCSGWLDQGMRDTCTGDEGGPIYHNNVQYGIYSFNQACGSAFFPSVNTRVPAHISWIQANAV